jgi:hypothetical protein
MMKLLLFFVLYALCSPITCLISNNDSHTFTLDTQNPEVILQVPVGGENWYSGEYNSIIWNASDSNLPIYPSQVFYSLDDGINWYKITDTIINCTCDWMIPDLVSSQAKIRIIVTDSYGNTGEDESDNVFSILNLLPDSPLNVSIQAINTNDVLVRWNAVTLDTHGHPFTPDGYIILFRDTPFPISQFQVLAITNDLEYLHLEALNSYQHMFYCIIAYKSDNPKLLGIFKEYNQKSQSLNWDQLKQLITRSRR